MGSAATTAANCAERRRRTPTTNAPWRSTRSTRRRCGRGRGALGDIRFIGVDVVHDGRASFQLGRVPWQASWRFAAAGGRVTRGGGVSTLGVPLSQPTRPCHDGTTRVNRELQAQARWPPRVQERRCRSDDCADCRFIPPRPACAASRVSRSARRRSPPSRRGLWRPCGCPTPDRRRCCCSAVRSR